MTDTCAICHCSLENMGYIWGKGGVNRKDDIRVCDKCNDLCWTVLYILWRKDGPFVSISTLEINRIFKFVFSELTNGNYDILYSIL